MLGYFKELINKTTQTQYNNAKIEWTMGKDYIELLEILKEFPGSAPSKESVDELGKFLPSGTRGIIFANKEQLNSFLKKYGNKYKARSINEYLPTKVKAL